jgi:metal-dependent amidase/aminoacylase/carboxypeptidase family protein
VGFELTFFGKEAHASAAPWEGRNTVDALTLAQVAIGLLRQQLRPGDQVHHMVKTGGSFANIIPAKSVAQFMCRSINIERLNELRVRVDKCFQAATLATDTSYEIEVLGHEFTHMISDGDILKHYRNNAERFGRTFELDDEGEAKPTISTDMANVSLVTPSIHPLIKIESNGAINHQPEFTASCITPSADQAVLEGAMIMAMTAVDTALDVPLRTRLLQRITR